MEQRISHNDPPGNPDSHRRPVIVSSPAQHCTADERANERRAAFFANNLLARWPQDVGAFERVKKINASSEFLDPTYVTYVEYDIGTMDRPSRFASCVLRERETHYGYTIPIWAGLAVRTRPSSVKFDSRWWSECKTFRSRLRRREDHSASTRSCELSCPGNIAIK